MLDLSMHILDIVQNSIEAGATEIEIIIHENLAQNGLTIQIEDNGRGIAKEMRDKICDPFTTSRSTRPVGLGLSLLKEAAQRCGGEIEIQSEEGRGTKVKAFFQLDHLDRPPLGDMGETIAVLILANPRLDFRYTHQVNHCIYCLDTKIIREILGDLPLDSSWIFDYIKRDIAQGLKNIGAASFPKGMEVLK